MRISDWFRAVGVPGRNVRHDRDLVRGDVLAVRAQ